MTKIGLISDTHSFLDPLVFEHFKDCDEIWHAGDVGDIAIIKKLEKFKPTKVVYGNIDNLEIRTATTENLIFEVEGLKILMTHIGSLPPRYNLRIRNLIKMYSPNLFICGHSHVPMVKKDGSKLVYINPGAAGNHGFHRVKTIMKMVLDNGKVTNLELVELGHR